MGEAGRWIAVAGLALTGLGVAIWLLARAGFGGLPGDIRYESGGFRFFFPVVTCLALSALLTLALWLWRWFGRGG